MVMVVGSWGFYSNKQLLHLMFHILHCPHFLPLLPPFLCIFNCSNVSRHTVSLVPPETKAGHSQGDTELTRGRRNQGYYVNPLWVGGGGLVQHQFCMFDENPMTGPAGEGRSKRPVE